MTKFEVFMQLKPKHIQRSEEWQANLKLVGEVFAQDGIDAIAQAKMKRICRHPIVCEARSLQ